MRRRSGAAVVVVVVVALVLAVGLVGVFWLLPKWVADRPEGSTPQRVEVKTAPLPETSRMVEVEATLQKAEEEWGRLTDRSVGLWAPVRSRELNDLLKVSRDLVKNGSPAEAGRALEDLSAGFDELNALATNLANQSVIEGKRWLEAGNANDAAASFERALLVDPDDSRARQSLGDAERLAAALQALERGGGFERSGDPAAAAVEYRIAILKAPWLGEANLALARVQEGEIDTEYARVLSQALVAIENGEWGPAESALKQAGAMRPGALEVEDGLLRLTSLRRLEDIGRLQNDARDFEAQEAWVQAAATYRKILELTPASLTAEEGEQRATERNELDVKLKGHLAHPGRLSETAVLNDARSLVATAENVIAKGPRLQEQVHRLDDLVQRMSTPMQVELLSDGQTEVTIYRVGRLGRFEHRVVEILPGSYTVVGARSGFRDVRLTLEVRVGERPAPLAVRCEEAL
ncbi:MAG: hypothetical protein DRJ65_03710 [Acidobacteria bacterium]|nr:MAG: hypothetical protein DRJ65_03710 [Acidobacteriota bacterium]